MAYPKDVIDKLDSKYDFAKRDRAYVASFGIGEKELPVTVESNYFREMLTTALTVPGMEEIVTSGMFDAEELIRQRPSDGVSGLTVVSDSTASQIVEAYEVVKDYESIKCGAIKLKDMMVDVERGNFTSVCVMSPSYAEQVAKNPSRLNEIRQKVANPMDFGFFGGGQRVNGVGEGMEKVAKFNMNNM